MYLCTSNRTQKVLYKDILASISYIRSGVPEIQYYDSNFLGHLSHSGDLLLWVDVRRRASCVNIFSSETTGPNHYQIWYVASLGEVDQKL